MGIMLPPPAETEKQVGVDRIQLNTDFVKRSKNNNDWIGGGLFLRQVSIVESIAD